MVLNHKKELDTNRPTMFRQKKKHSGVPSMESQSHQSPLTPVKNRESSLPDIRTSIILRWWAIQIILLSGFMTYILAKFTLNVNLSMLQQLILRLHLTMVSLSQSMPIILSSLLLLKITSMVFITFGVCTIIRQKLRMYDTTIVKMRENYFSPLLLSGVILLPALTL